MYDLRMANMPIPHLQPMPFSATTLATMKAATHGVIRKGKNEKPIANALHLGLNRSVRMTFYEWFSNWTLSPRSNVLTFEVVILTVITLVPDWPIL